MEFYRQKLAISNAVDKMVKNAIINKKILMINDFIRNIPNAGEKMIRARLLVYEIDGYIRIKKSPIHSYRDEVVPANVDETGE